MHKSSGKNVYLAVLKLVSPLTVSGIDFKIDGFGLFPVFRNPSEEQTMFFFPDILLGFYFAITSVTHISAIFILYETLKGVTFLNSAPRRNTTIK